jgi:gluconokinase
MPASLLTSQFETLEPLAPDERGVVVDVSGSVDQIVEGYLAETRLEER